MDNEEFRRLAKEEEETIEFSSEEQGYRRGFHQGFYAGRNTQTSLDEVRKWRYSNEQTTPPGTALAGMKINCLK